MTYQEWIIDHNEKVSKILNKLSLQGISTVEEIVDYFDFDSMVKNEPEFCPLYKDNIKCHSIEKLNCYHCACPHFVINKNPATKGKTTIASVCGIDSRFKDEFYENPDENNVVKIHCDCTNCYLPHKQSYVIKSLHNQQKDYIALKECESLLDYLRVNQMKKK
jgi:hypothetical protein